MTDPLSLIAAGAAVGGAAGKFVEKAWDAGERWISTYFADHHERSVEQAKANAADFLNQLAERVKELEASNKVPPAEIAASQQHPEFSAALQQAVLTAAQTENPEKHQLLARLIADRLGAAPEGLLALAGKMACASLAFATPNQLRILGLDSVLLHVRPTQTVPREQYTLWLLKHTAPFSHVEIREIDLVHLEALSCLKFESFVGRDLQQILAGNNHGEFDSDLFFRNPVGIAVQKAWQEGKLQSVTLTSVGQLIGIYVSDLMSGSTTSLAGWE